MPFIGIDLGTTYSCVASAKKGLPEVIANDQGSRTTPSCVAFVDCNRLIGEAAVQQIARNPLNTVFDVKRLMGRSFNEPCVTEDRRRLPYEVCNDNGKPKVTVFYKGEKKQFSPEQISSMILERMKKFAEDFLGEGVMGAVITVPAYFNDAQRRATRDAAAVAKIHVLGLINEPTAAAIAYGLEKDPDVSRNVLIFDLGGGTFDVTVMTINNGEFTVKATDGDTHLGGEDFNNRLFNHFAQEIKKKHGVDIKTRLRPASRLRNKCEEAKKILSTTTRANIELDGLIDGEDFDTHMTRVRFEQLNDDLFRGTMETVHKTLDAAGMTVAEIDEVVLIGGSTRIPAIQKQLQDVFGAEKIHKTINPEEAVAVGAAAYAESFSKSPLPKARKFVLHDVTPLSLGIATLGDVMTVVVKRNTQIPVKKNHIFTTVKDDQTVVDFKVYEGERYVAKQNHLLGNFKLEDITLAPAGVPSLKTCFQIDKDGVLEVTAVDEGTENKNSVKITKEGRETDEEEIQRMVEEAEVFRKDDEEWRLRVQAANELEACANRTRNKLVDGEIPKDSEIQKLRAIETCDEILQFVAEKRDPDVGEITEKMAQLKHVMDVD